MTELNRPVRRKTRREYSLLYVNEPRRIVVELQPGDVLSFRELGRTKTWLLPIESAFRIALQRTIVSSFGRKRRKRSS